MIKLAPPIELQPSLELQHNTVCYVVFCWLRHSVDIIGVYSTEDEAAKARQHWIDNHPDPEWEKVSGERRNNTLIVKRISGQQASDKA